MKSDLVRCGNGLYGAGLVFCTRERHAQFPPITGKLHACLKTTLYIYIYIYGACLL